MDAEAAELGLDRAWALLQALSRRVAAGNPVHDPCCLRLADNGSLEEVSDERAWIRVDPSEDPYLSLLSPTDPAVERMLALYAPLCAGARAETLVIGHVGQSLDGQIATRTGASRYITGGENLAHVHRLRALVDAVVVGASTVECDDPQLTTRLVSGRSPVRVVIDPNLRLPFERRVFTDGAVNTLVVCAEDAPRARSHHPAELVPV
ncbi:MAG TPA: RibD family protein, partial [Polyangiaceae bacterium]